MRRSHAELRLRRQNHEWASSIQSGCRRSEIHHWTTLYCCPINPNESTCCWWILEGENFAFRRVVDRLRDFPLSRDDPLRLLIRVHPCRQTVAQMMNGGIRLLRTRMGKSACTVNR